MRSKKRDHKFINNYGKRYAVAIKSAMPNISAMDAIYLNRRKTLVNYAQKETAQILNGTRSRSLHDKRLEVFDNDYKKLKKEALAFHSIKNKVFSDADLERKDDFYQAFLRIPMGSFLELNKQSDSQREIIIKKLIDKELSCGNGCNHSYNDLQISGFISPLDYNPDNKQRIPAILYEAIDRMIFAVLHPDRFTSLFFHKTKNKVNRWSKNIRKIREEGRVGMMRLLIVLLQKMDITSLRAGVYNPETEEFFGLSREKLAKECNMSVDRVKTALRNLEETDIIHKASQKREKDAETQEWRGFTVVRVFKINFFECVGLGQRLSEARNPEKQRLKLEKAERAKKYKSESDAREAKVAREIERSKKYNLEKLERQKNATPMPSNFFSQLANPKYQTEN